MILIDKILYRNLNEKYFGFKTQGSGILRRAKEYEHEWLPHLSNSKQIIADWLSNNSNRKVLSILGSGSLLDMPENIFNNSPRKIILTDANINCLRSIYSKQKEQFSSTTLIFQDVSLVLKTWLEYLQASTNKSLDEFLVILRNLPKILPAPLNTFYRGDLMLSLNLTSQIPIHWNFAVNRIIENRYGKNKTLNYQEKTDRALIPSSQNLIEAHLNSLIPSRKKSSTLIITDLKYYFPDNQLQEIKIKEPKSLVPEVEFITVTKGTASTILEQDALYGFDLNNWLSKVSNTIGYNIINSWIWNLVPRNIRHEEQELHIVSALELFKR